MGIPSAVDCPWFSLSTQFPHCQRNSQLPNLPICYSDTEKPNRPQYHFKNCAKSGLEPMINQITTLYELHKNVKPASSSRLGQSCWSEACLTLFFRICKMKLCPRPRCTAISCNWRKPCSQRPPRTTWRRWSCSWKSWMSAGETYHRRSTEGWFLAKGPRMVLLCLQEWMVCFVWFCLMWRFKGRL